MRSRPPETHASQDGVGFLFAVELLLPELCKRDATDDRISKWCPLEDSNF